MMEEFEENLCHACTRAVVLDSQVVLSMKVELSWRYVFHAERPTFTILDSIEISGSYRNSLESAKLG